jgi:hypothetical protein
MCKKGVILKAPLLHARTGDESWRRLKDLYSRGRKSAGGIVADVIDPSVAARHRRRRRCSEAATLRMTLFCTINLENWDHTESTEEAEEAEE